MQKFELLRRSLALICASFFFDSSADTSPKRTKVERISSSYQNLGQSRRIYLHSGLISVIEFPHAIIEVRVGNPKSFKALISTVSPRELTLYLARQNVEPTNLIVKSEKRFYVFDVIPSKNSHQDYIKISGSFGAPVYSEAPSSVQVSHKPRGEPGRLIETIKIGVE